MITCSKGGQKSSLPTILSSLQFIQCHLLIVCVRMSYRRQKRWWNAYILFYERLDVVDQNRTIDVDRSKYMNRIRGERDFDLPVGVLNFVKSD